MIRTRLLITFSLCLLPILTASAQTTDIVVSGATQLIPISSPTLCNEGGVLSADKEIPKALLRDLDLSGYFKTLSPESYIESPGKCGGASNVAFSDWTAIGSDFVIRGSAFQTGSTLRVQLYLIDAFKQASVLAKEYNGNTSDAVMMGHKFANEILKFFTGELGPFGSQIAYSVKNGRFKELAIMDMDGSNVRQLTSNKGLAKNASFSPSGRELAFTDYKNRVPDLFTINIGSRAQSRITNDMEMQIGPHFLNESEIVASRSEGSGSSLVVYDRSGRMTRKLITGGGTINVSPSFSPDKSQMVFCSDRGGSPQVYKANADGSGATRVSFVASGYCSSPVWSPKGDKIAFICRADGGFNLFTANPDGSAPLQLTSYGSNEDADWSPDGRYLVFSSTARTGVTSLAMIRSDGANMRQLTNSKTPESEPSWGPRP